MDGGCNKTFVSPGLALQLFIELITFVSNVSSVYVSMKIDRIIGIFTYQNYEVLNATIFYGGGGYQFHNDKNTRSLTLSIIDFSHTAKLTIRV